MVKHKRLAPQPLRHVPEILHEFIGVHRPEVVVQLDPPGQLILPHLLHLSLRLIPQVHIVTQHHEVHRPVQIVGDKSLNSSSHRLFQKDSTHFVTLVKRMTEQFLNKSSLPDATASANERDLSVTPTTPHLL